MANGAVIPQNRTAVPVEWDDFRKQLEKLTECCSPPSPAASARWAPLINTAADNLRGQGANIRDTIIKLSQAVSALGDHSNDIFATVKNLSTLVAALHDSADLMAQLNTNLAAVTSLLANDPTRSRTRCEDFNAAVQRCDRASSPTTARRWAPRRTSWRRSPRRSLTASTTSSRRCTCCPTRCRTSSTSIEPAHGCDHRHARR